MITNEMVAAIDVGNRMNEIPPELLESIRAWMLSAHLETEHISAFDLAVDCAYGHSPRLATAENHYEIPVYCVEIAESILGKD